MLLKKPNEKDDVLIASGRDRSMGLLSPCISPAVKTVEAVIAEIAATDIPILISGETGTGKEVVALAIHRASKRHDEAFVKVRCSSLTPEDFSRLLPVKQGRTGNGVGGTLLLDEIADLDLPCQAKLLESFSETDGGAEAAHSGTGFISTTCQDLEQIMQSGQFRRDLFYRLSGVCLRLPPLRQRKEDITPLANFFLDKYSRIFERQRPELDSAMVELLNGYSWPGNVRELENAVKRVVALGDGELAWKDLIETSQASANISSERASHSLKQAARAASRRAERELILKTLSHTKWNRKRAAEELRISYKALLYKLKQIGLEEHTP
jgi:DNA-binding NtrC family response regulator